MIKHFTIFLIFLAAFHTVHSQVKCNTALIRVLQERQPAGQRFDVLVQVKPGQLDALKRIPSLQVKYSANNIASVNADMPALLALAGDQAVVYMEYVRANTRVMNDSMVVRNRMQAVKTGQAPLTQAYDGNGVIIGFIDSGIDYHHPDFQDASGHTRIRYIWDMTISSPTATPMPFNYGQEWTSADIDGGSCTHTGTSEFGHGTHVAGIAAGNGNAINHFEGVAPKTDIIMVALDFYRPGPTIADAVQYIASKATALGKPFVVNASVGDYYGSHDGTDLQAQLIDGLISNIPGRSLIGAAGNGGSIPFHNAYTVTPADTFFTWLSNTTQQIDYWMYGDTSDVKNIRYSVGVNSPNYNDLGRISFKPYNYGMGTTKNDTIYNNGNRIGIVQSSASVNSFGVYELYVSVKVDSTGYNWRIEKTGNGKFDAWNFDFVTANLPTASQYPRMAKYKVADTLQTLVSSFQCSNEIVTIGNYVNRNHYVDVSGTTQVTTESTGQISASSSTGPSRDHKVKPEVAASGATSISCMVLSLAPGLISAAPNVVAQGGYHVVDGGTSSACPVVAGWAALYLQANPTATNRQIRNAIINCTYTDAYTGTALPDNRWGYGKIDGFKAFTCDLSTAGINESQVEAGISVFPNPAKSVLHIRCPDARSRQYKLYDVLGNVLASGSSGNEAFSLNIGQIASGTYILEIGAQNKITKRKVMVE